MIDGNCNLPFQLIWDWDYKKIYIYLIKRVFFFWVEKLLELKERENTAPCCVGRRSIGPIVDHEKGTGLNGMVKGFSVIHSITKEIQIPSATTNMITVNAILLGSWGTVSRIPPKCSNKKQ